MRHPNGAAGGVAWRRRPPCLRAHGRPPAPHPHPSQRAEPHRPRAHCRDPSQAERRPSPSVRTATRWSPRRGCAWHPSDGVAAADTGVKEVVFAFSPPHGAAVGVHAQNVSTPQVGSKVPKGKSKEQR